MKLRFVGAAPLLAALTVGISPAVAKQPQEPPTKPNTGPLRKGSRANPEFTALLQREIDQKAEACKLLREKRWAEAEVKFKEAIAALKIFPPDQHYAELAEAQYQQGEFSEALQSMKTAFYPKLPSALKSTGSLGSNPTIVARFEEIAQRFGEAELVAPLWEKAFHSAQARHGLVKRAAKTAQTPKQRKALVLVGAGQIAELRSDLARMKELNLLALQADPECALAHFYLARLGGMTLESLAHLEAAYEYGDPDLKRLVETPLHNLQYLRDEPKQIKL